MRKIWVDRTSDKAKWLWANSMLISIVLQVGDKKYYGAGTIQQLGQLEFRRELRATLRSLRGNGEQGHH